MKIETITYKRVKNLGNYQSETFEATAIVEQAEEVSVCFLTSKPLSPRQFYYECPFMLFSANSERIKALLALKPDIAVIEPTGVNYSRMKGNTPCPCRGRGQACGTQRIEKLPGTPFKFTRQRR